MVSVIISVVTDFIPHFHSSSLASLNTLTYPNFGPFKTQCFVMPNNYYFGVNNSLFPWTQKLPTHARRIFKHKEPELAFFLNKTQITHLADWGLVYIPNKLHKQFSHWDMHSPRSAVLSWGWFCTSPSPDIWQCKHLTSANIYGCHNWRGGLLLAPSG